MDVDVREVAPGVWHARGKHVSWVLVVDGGEVTLVDTGFPGDRERVMASLAKVGRSPADVAAVILTHAHPDHLGSAEHFRTALGKRVLAHELEVPNATGARIEQASIRTLLSMAWRPDVVVWVREAMSLGATKVERLGALETFTTDALDVPGRPVPVFTPGHTSGHCAFHLPERGALLVGDALMTDHALSHPAGPTLLPTFFNHDNDQARASLDALAGLSAEVVVPGHGAAFVGSPADAVAAARAAVQAGPTGAPARISYGAVIPLPSNEAFAFVTDPENWQLFFSTIRAVEKGTDWEGVGGRASMTHEVLGRTFTSELEMTVWDPPHEFRYLARQPGAPVFDNRRVFEPVAGGTRMRGTSEAAARAGVTGLIDRTRARALRRMYDEAMVRLPDAALAAHRLKEE
jgi:glyoxylase-like metal-dependent hydrolase (beta-lactamase superfamily II)